MGQYQKRLGCHAWISRKSTVAHLVLAFCPLMSVSASLLFPPHETGGDKIGNGRLAEGLYLMGEMLQLGNSLTESEKTTSIRELIAERDPNFWLPVKDEDRQKWKKIVNHLASAIDGFDDVNDDVVMMQALLILRYGFKRGILKQGPF